jgi:hypothetical protein
MSSVELNKHTYCKKKVILVASAELSIEVNAEKTKKVFISCEQNGGHHLNIGTFESVTKSIYLGTTLIYLFIYLFIHSLIHSFIL